MSITLLESWSVTNYAVTVKFLNSVKVSSITNDRFALYVDDVLETASPFQDISTAIDYNSISKTLTLYWKNDVLSADTDYVLKLTGFRTAGNVVIDDFELQFTTGASATPSASTLTEPEELEIIDYSLIPNAFVLTDSEGNAETETETIALQLLEADPLDEDAFLSEDYNNGVVILKFNAAPNEDFINDTFFRGERKKLQKRPSKWETVPVEVELDNSLPWVYVKFPSNDATPVYDTTGSTYWDENYIYRVRILGNVGV